MTRTIRGAGLGARAAWAMALLVAGCADADGNGSDSAPARALRPHIGHLQPPCLRAAFPFSPAPEQPELRDALRELVRAGWLVEHDQIEERPLAPTGRLWLPRPRSELTARGRRHYRDDVGGLCL